MELAATIRSRPRENTAIVLTAILGASLAVSLFYTPIPFAVCLAIPFFLYFSSRPYELLVVMAFLIPFNFIVKIGQIPVAVELLKVFIWIPFLIDRQNRGLAIKTTKYNKYLVVWGAIIFFSLLRSTDLAFALKENVRLASNLGLCFIAVNLVDTREKVLQILRVLAVSGFLVALYGFYQWTIQDYGALFWIVNPRIETGLSPDRYTFWEWRHRIISVLTSEMELGHYFNMSLPIALVLWLNARHQRGSTKWLLMALCMLAGLVLTFTFGAWLALATTTAAFVLLLDKKRRWKLLFTGIAGFAATACVVAYTPALRALVEDKIVSTGMDGLAWDIYSRLQAWTFAIQTWRAHPLFGVGVGNYQGIEYTNQLVASPWAITGSTPHETYLYLLAIGGVVGLVTMLILVGGVIRDNIRLRSDPEYGLIAIGMAFSIAVNMIGSFSDDSPFTGPHASYLLWLMIGLSLAVGNLARTARAPIGGIGSS